MYGRFEEGDDYDDFYDDDENGGIFGHEKDTSVEPVHLEHSLSEPELILQGARAIHTILEKVFGNHTLFSTLAHLMSTYNAFLNEDTAQEIIGANDAVLRAYKKTEFVSIGIREGLPKRKLFNALEFLDTKYGYTSKNLVLTPELFIEGYTAATLFDREYRSEYSALPLDKLGDFQTFL